MFLLPDHSCHLYPEALSHLDNLCLKFQVSTQVLLANGGGCALWPIHLSIFTFSLPGVITDPVPEYQDVKLTTEVGEVSGREER